MKTVEKLEYWFEEELPGLLSKLKPETPPEWGSMNATQMLDHLSEVFNLAMVEYILPVETISEKAGKYKTVGLLSDRPMPKGFNNPILKLLIKTTEPAFDEARTRLTERYYAFKNYFATHPGAETPHNMFGYLNYHEWLWFHYKHFLHHLAQFGLVPYHEKIELK